MHTYIHTYTHTYEHTYIHTYMMDRSKMADDVSHKLRTL